MRNFILINDIIITKIWLNGYLFVVDSLLFQFETIIYDKDYC